MFNKIYVSGHCPFFKIQTLQDLYVPTYSAMNSAKNAHFFQPDHNGMKDLSVKIIDKTDEKDATRGERFWAYKLNSFIPLGLNSRDFLLFIIISL